MRTLVCSLWCAGLLACAASSKADRADGAIGSTGAGGEDASAGRGGASAGDGGATGGSGGASDGGGGGAVVDASVPDARTPDVGDEAAAKACGAYALCDDFESVVVGGAPDSALWTVGAPDLTGTGGLAIDDREHHSGARSVKVTGQGGYSNHIFFTNRAALARVGTVVWGRFYLRLEDALGDGHVTFLSMKDAADNGKFLRMGGQAKILMWNRESDDATLPALSPTGVALSRVLPPQQWLCVELMVDGATGELRTWLDGVEVPGLVVDGTSTADVDEQWHRRPSWRPSLVDFSLGWESYAGQAMTLWLDDVALDGARIGCL